jgi:hypothetical protein
MEDSWLQELMFGLLMGYRRREHKAAWHAQHRRFFKVG